jgi:hypothetical protein
MPSRLVPVCQVLWRGQGARCQCEFTLQCDTLLIADTLDNNAGHTFLTVVRTQRNYRRDPQIRRAFTRDNNSRFLFSTWSTKSSGSRRNGVLVAPLEAFPRSLANTLRSLHPRFRLLSRDAINKPPFARNAGI